jgi:hypothetical protein
METRRRVVKIRKLLLVSVVVLTVFGTVTVSSFFSPAYAVKDCFGIFNRDDFSGMLTDLIDQLKGLLTDQGEDRTEGVIVENVPAEVTGSLRGEAVSAVTDAHSDVSADQIVIVADLGGSLFVGTDFGDSFTIPFNSASGSMDSGNMNRFTGGYTMTYRSSVTSDVKGAPGTGGVRKKIRILDSSGERNIQPIVE